VSLHENLLEGPPPTLLPDEVEARASNSDGGADAYTTSRAVTPRRSLAWAVLADAAWNEGRIVESYAFARVGYHRGLDALRRNGWKGHGPVPWAHEPNRGFLLGRAAQAIGEEEEVTRIGDFLTECDVNAPRW
jgi:hypothetical protein